MSLVVGEIHDGVISLVADTKITIANDDIHTRHVLENAIPKLVILRDDLTVGLAGNDPIGTIGRLVANREKPVDEILAVAAGMPHAAFVVAHLGGTPSLWQVADRTVEDRTLIGRAWVGDKAGYEIFQERYSEWPDGVDSAFRLLSSLQWLLTWNTIPTIGGYHTRVGTTSEGFRFVPDGTTIGPEEMHGLARVTSGALNLQLAPPKDGDQSSLSLMCAVGCPPTYGALAFLAAPPGLAVLFPHSTPMEPVTIRVNSMSELIQVASTDHGQFIVG